MNFTFDQPMSQDRLEQLELSSAEIVDVQLVTNHQATTRIEQAESDQSRNRLIKAPYQKRSYALSEHRKAPLRRHVEWASNIVFLYINDHW